MVGYSGNRIHDAAVTAAEGVRQAAVTPSSSAAAVRAAEAQFYRTVKASAIANGVSPEQAILALDELGFNGQ